MVTVCMHHGLYLSDTHMSGQKWGYSSKIGPVYYSDREQNLSPQKKDEIDAEVKEYVLTFSSWVLHRVTRVKFAVFATCAAARWPLQIAFIMETMLTHGD